MKRPFFAPISILWVVVSLLSACSGANLNESTCIGCHFGLEPASFNHQDCVDCHGGDPQEEDKDASHRSMYGPKNPSDPRFWENTCGRCHPHQLNRVRSSLMYTNTGMIKNIQKTWEGEDGRLYGTRAAAVFSADGSPVVLDSVAGLDNLAGELYRKFCSRCHIGREENRKYSASHNSGCAACHFPYNDSRLCRAMMSACDATTAAVVSHYPIWVCMTATTPWFRLETVYRVPG